MIITPKLETFTKANGTARIYIYLYDTATRTKAKVSTEFFSKPEDWSGDCILPKRAHGSFINPKITQIKLDLEAIHLRNPGLVPAQIKQIYSGPKTIFTPAAYFRHYIAQCKEGQITKKNTKDRMTPGYLKALGTSCAQLEAYGPVSWSQLTDEFFDKFVTRLRDKGYKQNTIAKYVKYIVIMANYARRKKIHDHDVVEYSIRTEKAQKIRLTPEEVERMSTVDLSEWPELIPEQERFMVAYNLLLRFTDSISINEKNIVLKNKRAYLSTFTQKGRKQVLLPIQMKVYKILQKNHFKVSGCNSKSNKKLKKIGLLAKVNTPVTLTEFKEGKKIEVSHKKYELIETHTTRRSAARNLFDAGLEPEVIMVLGGWSTMKQLLDYIDIDLDYAASKAADHPFFN